MAHKKHNPHRGNTFVGFAPRIQDGSKKRKAEKIRNKHKKLVADQTYMEGYIMRSVNDIRIWVDDIRIIPDEYTNWCKSVRECIDTIEYARRNNRVVSIIDLDHDSGEYYDDGGDYIRILDYIEQYYPDNDIVFRIHTQNPVGRDNMLSIILNNGWKYEF